MYSIDTMTSLNLGEQGEHLATEIRVDMSPWVDEDNTLRFYIVALRHAETNPYIPATTMEDNILVWPVTSADTAITGAGLAQFVATDGTRIVKSKRIKTAVGEIVPGTDSDTPPDPASGWVERVINTVQSLTEDAQAAKADAESAAEHAQDVTEGIDQAGAAQIQAVQAAGAEVINSIPADYSDLTNDVNDLKSALHKSIGMIHTDKNEISPSTGSAVQIENGHVNVIGTSSYWKTLVAPVDSLYIDGVATLKSGGLSGARSVNIPTMVFMDENYDVVGAPVYSSIPAPHTFSETDIPSGAVYVGCCFSNQFVFAFNSISSQTKQNKEEIAKTNEQLENAGRYEIPLYFASTTGYYNKDKGYTEYATSRAAEVPTSAGNIYFLTSRCYFGMAQVAFLGSNDAVVSVVYTGGGTSAVDNVRFVAPENAVKMLVQMIGDYPITLWQTDIKAKLDTAVSDIAEIENTTTEPSGEEVVLTYESATGYYAVNKSFSEYNGVTVAKVSVTEGQQYLLTTRNYANAAIACFLDSQDAVLGVVFVANNMQEVLDYPITIPSSVSKLMIQRFYGYSPTKLELVTGIKSKSVKSILDGKRVTIIGDSITEKNSRAKTNWALWIKDWANPTIQNLGASGTGFIAGGSNPYSNRIQSINNPDIIGVACSFNDMSNTIEDLTTAAETFFDTLIGSYPTVPIICYVQSPWSAYHYGIEKSDQWINALKEVCQTRGIPFYDDMYKGSVLKPWLAANRAVYYINDGEGSTGEEDWVHPNSEGHKVIARHLYPHFAENLVAVGLDYFK